MDFDVKVRKVQDVVMFLKDCPSEEAARDNPYAYCSGQSPVPGGKSYYVLEVNQPEAL